jgi:hypothetical protein
MTRAEIFLFAHHQNGRRTRQLKFASRDAFSCLPTTSLYVASCALLQRVMCLCNFFAKCNGFTSSPAFGVRLVDFEANSVERASGVVGARGQGGKPISCCLLLSCGRRAFNTHKHYSTWTGRRNSKSESPPRQISSRNSNHNYIWRSRLLFPQQNVAPSHG